jgi:hypothetical protein
MVSTVAVLLVVPNLAATWSSAKPTPYLAQAREVAAVVGPQDLVVGDWNNAFLHYSALWSERENSFNLPTQALWNGAASIQQMQAAIAHTQKSGGKVFFLGILDVSESDWKIYYLGEPLNAPYSAFAEYRRCARTVESFSTDRRPVTLRQYAPCTDHTLQIPGPDTPEMGQPVSPAGNSAAGRNAG